MNLHNSDEKILLESKIKHKGELMEGKAKEFNQHYSEAQRLQLVVENLWLEINTDQRKLSEIESKNF